MCRRAHSKHFHVGLFCCYGDGLCPSPSREALSHSAKHLRNVTQSLIYNTNLAIGFETLPIARTKNNLALPSSITAPYNPRWQTPVLRRRRSEWTSLHEETKNCAAEPIRSIFTLVSFCCYVRRALSEPVSRGTFSLSKASTLCNAQLK